jgi:hypothetical protein
MTVASWLQDHSVLILAALAVVEGLICLALLRVARHARHEMQAAQAAALESARAAALAAPGAIDPEAVLALLRQGHAPTLDNVYAMMRRRELEGTDKTEDPPSTPATVSATARGAAPASLTTASESAGTAPLTSAQVEERLRRY